MIEVFRTDVNHQEQAQMLIAEIQKTFCQYKANFDLDDCDNILRIKSNGGCIQASQLIGFLNDLGYNAEVLPDTPSIILS